LLVVITSGTVAVGAVGCGLTASESGTGSAQSRLVNDSTMDASLSDDGGAVDEDAGAVGDDSSCDFDAAPPVDPEADLFDAAVCGTFGGGNTPDDSYPTYTPTSTDDTVETIETPQCAPSQYPYPIGAEGPYEDDAVDDWPHNGICPDGNPPLLQVGAQGRCLIQYYAEAANPSVVTGMNTSWGEGHLGGMWQNLLLKGVDTDFYTNQTGKQTTYAFTCATRTNAQTGRKYCVLSATPGHMTPSNGRVTERSDAWNPQIGGPILHHWSSHDSFYSNSCGGDPFLQAEIAHSNVIQDYRTQASVHKTLLLDSNLAAAGRAGLGSAVRVRFAYGPVQVSTTVEGPTVANKRDYMDTEDCIFYNIVNGVPVKP
jgi:hypothetical protein